MIKTDRFGIPTNYIQKLEFLLKRQGGALDGLNEGLQYLTRYLYSEKFYLDRSVSVDDIINRIQDAQELSTDEELKSGMDYLV
jgi:hypothetical protein